jgi:light-harvesting complex II chlorophyll a/b binding protein 7
MPGALQVQERLEAQLPELQAKAEDTRREHAEARSRSSW